ncbi:TonB-dependent receptor [Aestuariicella sp. G3-2]|uniref:TonB-dependent receptor n=1 Tax=Pseudomaricurvus albidus TaxID=2842452 RepID=UPI001C0CA54A|nr:TonB-dependent receptor [Aestuariicella albida]MBU3069588.1 TonB-dependent receptor [Aestuariicella albida]
MLTYGIDKKIGVSVNSWWSQSLDVMLRAMFLGSVSIGALSGPLHAAESASRSTFMDEMTVTARRDAESEKSLIGQVGQISSNAIQTQGHTHLQELAVRIPGAWFSRGNGQEMLAAVRSPVYTGAGSCGEVLIAENGIPIRPSGLCNVNQLFEVNTEQAGALEVWRGAGTVFYGSNAVHGVVNTLTPLFGEKYFTLEAGPHDYYRSKLAWAVEQGDHHWQLNANGASDDGLKDDAGYDQQKMTVQHRWDGEAMAAKTTLSLVNLNQETAGYLRGYEAYKDSGWKDNPNPEAFRDAQAARLVSTLSWQINENSQWQLSPYARYSDMRFLQHYLPGQPIEENGQKSVGFLLNYQTSFNDQWRLWTGFDGEWAEMFVKETQADVLGTPDNARYQGAHYDFDVTSNQLAAFVNAEWSWRPEVAVELGLRWETLTYDYDNQLLDGSTQDDGSDCATPDLECRYYRPADRKDRFENISAQLGGRYQVSDQWTVYGRLARAFRAPQINERYRLLAGQDVGEFDKKTIDSLEFGTRYYSDRFTAELSAYVMKKQDEVLKASNNATVGDGDTHHYGVELQATYIFSPQWQLSGNLARAEHSVKSASAFASGVDVSGNEMDTAPEWLGSVQLRYQPVERWWLELETVYMDDYYLDAENEHQYDGHTLLNAIAKYQWNNQWSARLRLHNLTDTRYAERGDYAFGSYRYFTGENRAAYLEVRRQF